MKLILTLLVATGFLLLAVACKKEKDNKEPGNEKTPVELLTQQKWILTGYGFDDNNNKLVDEQEDMSRDCERDNSYEFFPDSTGVVKDNDKSCNTGNPVSPFDWEFSNGNKQLIIASTPVTIVTLNDTSLILLYHWAWLNDSARFTAVYRH